MMQSVKMPELIEDEQAQDLELTILMPCLRVCLIDRWAS